MRTGKRSAVTMTLAISATVLLTGCSGFMNKQAALVDINKGEATITLGYGNFVAKYNQAMYERAYGSYFGEDMWTQDMYGNGNTFEEDIKSELLDQMEEEYLLKLHAEDYKVALTEEDEKAIDKAAEKFMEDNAAAAIKAMGAKKEYVADMLTYATFAQRVTEAIKAEAEVSVSREEAAQRTFTYAFFDTQSQMDEDGNTAAVTEDDMSELLEHAQVTANAEDFEATAKELGATVEDYSYGKSEDSMDEKVIAAADSLSEGQVSGVIHVEGEGYYVIRLDKAFDEEATESEMESMEEEQRDEHYQDVLEGWKKDFKWKVDKKQWKKVTFDSRFEIKIRDDSE